MNALSTASHWLLGTRAQDILLGALAFRYAIAKALRPTRRRNQDDWAALDWSPSPDPRAAFDLPMLLALSLSGNYDTLAEIGCGHGWRIIAIKEARPSINACGFDVSSWYPKTAIERHGVSFARYDLSSIPRGALVFAVGTFTCFEPSEVRDTFRHFAERGNDVLHFEPYFADRLTTSIPRRAFSGWYHPYTAIAAESGFKDNLPEGYKWRSIDSIGSMERWGIGYWRRSTQENA